MDTATTQAVAASNHAPMRPEPAPEPDAQAPAAGLRLAWCWCACCRRAYPAGTYRIVRFGATRRHPYPRELRLCPYLGCSGSITRDQWRWTSVRAQHPEYPEEPQADTRYGIA